MTPLAILQYVIVWLPLVIGGIFLMRAGLRGRRVNDHPICRRCRFDLVGLAGSDADANSRPDRCPECGTDLTGTTRRARRAVIDGERRKRWRLFALGVVLLLSGLTTGFWLSYKPLAKFPWITWMPDWVLAEMVDSPNAVRADLAMRELLQRMATSTLSATSARAAINSALDAQADMTRPWNPRIGTFVETLRGAGLVDDALWSRYAQQSVVLQAWVRPRIEVGRSIPWAKGHVIRVGTGAWAAASGNKPASLGLEILCLDSLVNGNIVELGFAGVGSSTSAMKSQDGGIAGSSVLNVPGLGLGPVRVELRFRVTIFTSINFKTTFEPGDVLATWEETIGLDAEVVPAGTDSIRGISSLALNERMRRSISCEPFEVATDSRERAVVRGGLYADLPPAVGAFRVEATLRHADGSVEALPRARFTIRPGRRTSVAIAGTPTKALTPGASVSLTLKPDFDAAKNTVDLTEIWGEEIVIENVPITIKDK